MTDKQKAHEYYMKHRKLKGRKRKPKVSAGKATVIKEKDYKLLKSQLDDLKKRAVNLPPEKKKALKSSLNVIKSKIKKG